MNVPTKLLNAAATGAFSEKFQSAGDYVSVVAAGTFGGATLKVQVTPDGGTTWVDTGVTLTAAGVQNFITGEGLEYRLAITGGAGVAINAWVAFQD